MKAKEMTFEEIKVGNTSSFDKVISLDDVENFAKLSGDFSPIHMDEIYAQNTKFEKRIVHGMFLGSLVSKLVGMELPGKYAVLIKETLDFKIPAYIGDKINVNGIVTNKSPALKMIDISIKIMRGEDVLVKGLVNVILLK